MEPNITAAILEAKILLENFPEGDANTTRIKFIEIGARWKVLSRPELMNFFVACKSKKS
jgi:hypothetical protein